MDDSELLNLVREYEMPEAASDLLAAHPPLILAGVSASGKDSIVEHIQAASDWRYVVTHTSRPPRPGEVDGKDYWFVDAAGMQQLIKDQAFIEVKYIHANQISGSSIKAYNNVLESGHEPMMNIDVQGIETILGQGVDIRPFFILPPSFEAWMERLDKRGHMSHTEKLQRLNSAKTELDMAINSERFIFVVNEQIGHTAAEILQGFSDPNTQLSHRELAKQLIEHIEAY